MQRGSPLHSPDPPYAWHCLHLELNQIVGYFSRFKEGCMYRRFIVLAVLVAVVVSVVVVQSPAQAQGGTAFTATVRAALLSVRSGPEASAIRLSVLKVGTIVTVLGRNSLGTWLEIRTSQGLVGWVSAIWLKLSSGNLTTLPLISSTGVAGIVIALRLNVRSGPESSASKVGMLRVGDVVTPLARNSAGTWLKVQTSEGLVGWVLARWVILDATMLMHLPVMS